MASWTLLNWISVVGVIAGIAGAYFAWRALTSGKTKTHNVIEGGSRNTQSGGTGSTRNEVRNGDDNIQSG